MLRSQKLSPMPVESGVTNRVAVVHPLTGATGGGAAVTAWTAMALVDEVDVTLVSLRSIRLKVLDKLYGTRLKHSNVRTVSLVPESLLGVAALERCVYHLRRLLVSYYASMLRRRYDAIVSTYGEVGLVEADVEYLHSPNFAASVAGRPELGDCRLSKMDELKNRAQAALIGVDAAAQKRRCIVTNSQWTAARLDGAYGVEANVIYPPICRASIAQRPIRDRELGFVTIGRICRSKRLQEMIRLLEKVRNRGHDIHLHVVGGVEDQGYYREIQNLIERKGWNWIEFEHELDRNELEALMIKHRFGIHGREDEHFGMAPAELAAAGCITFVPESGGQTEVVKGRNLQYRDEHDGVEKICKMLAQDETYQAEIQQELVSEANKASCELFVLKMGRLVKNILPNRCT